MTTLNEFFDFFLKDQKVKGTITNFKGLLKSDKEINFLKISDLISFYMNIFYKDKIIVIIFNPKTAMEYIPKLAMLKRDNFDAHLKAKLSDFILIEFNDITKAEDWVFSFPVKDEIGYEIYSNGKLIRTNR